MQFSRAASNARSEELARDVGLSLINNPIAKDWKSRCSIAETKDEVNSQDGSAVGIFSEEEMDARNAVDFMKRKGGVNQILTYIPFLEPAKLPPLVPELEQEVVHELEKNVVQELPIVQNDIKCDLKCDKEDTNAPSAQHFDTPQSPFSSDVNDTTGPPSPSTRVLKNSTSEPSFSVMPLRPSDKPCPLSMAPRRKTEQRSLKSQNRYARPESLRLFTM
jgi:hypothetical protein